MRSCNSCPGGTACSGNNLAPVLRQVFDLHVDGAASKFDILFALGEDEVALLEIYTKNVERACWTKAGLTAVADVIMVRLADGDMEGDWQDHIEAAITTARDAFADFPWHLPDLVDQAPDLFEALNDQMCDDLPAGLTKRNFTKLCKKVVFG